MTTLENAQRLAAIIGGRAWAQPDGGLPRIYVDGWWSRKWRVCFAVDEDGGWGLRVWIPPCGQHPRWYASQRRKVLETPRLRAAALALAAAGDGCDDAALAVAHRIMAAGPDAWEAWDDAAIDDAARHFANGCLDAGLAALGLALDVTA